MVQIKRVYDQPAESDGTRVLVDRLWPRGVSKAHAHVDIWLKEIAPSTELRTWFSHDPEKFAAFTQKYMAELAHNPAVTELKGLLAKHKTVTLVYAAKDQHANHAVVLQKFIKDLV